MRKPYVILLAIFFVGFSGLALSQEFGLKVKRPKPHDFGNIIIDNYSSQAGQSPVVFKHWFHRAKFSCRLCHVDLGFAMKAGDTDITDQDIERGLYCGACHNGEMAFGQKSTSSKGGKDLTSCGRCHSYGKVNNIYSQKVAPGYDFYEFKKSLPKERFGNGIDWQAAEKSKKITLIDYLEGFSIKSFKIQSPDEFNLKPKENNMPEIIFSHAAHNTWLGCELCHPEIFPIKKGSQPYSMEDIFAGKFCGVCHGPVAFPNFDCQRCHTKSVY